jgi:RNA polymerase sigma-70 factor (ECF subfamily)
MAVGELELFDDRLPLRGWVRRGVPISREPERLSWPMKRPFFTLFFLTCPLASPTLRIAGRSRASRMTWRPYPCWRIFFGDRTNCSDDLPSVFEATTTRPRDPVGIRVIRCSPIEKEAIVGQGDAPGPILSSSAIETPSTQPPGPNAQALGELLQSFQPHLLSIARRHLPGDLQGKYDPADLVQETMLEVHRGLEGFNGTDSDAFRLWVCGILRHNLMDLVRRYRDTAKRSIGRERPIAADPESSHDAVQEVDPNPTPCTQSIAREDIAALRDALSSLPAHERSVIVLRYFDILSFEEIGRRLGGSPDAARKLCSRAVVRLKHLLKVGRGPEKSIKRSAAAEPAKRHRGEPRTPGKRDATPKSV